MERVETLCNRLLEQLSQNASPDSLLVTVQMLQSELLHLKAITAPGTEQAAVAIDIPISFETTEQAANPDDIKEEEKIIEVLQIDEAEVEAELEEIKKNAEAKNIMSSQNKPPMVFDPIEDTPTLIHQKHADKPKKELHESLGDKAEDSLNEKLRQSKLELSDALQDVPIKDLKKAININDRFLYISELFRGDEVMYERSIKTINSFAIYPEAEYWIKRELKLKLGWDDRAPIVKQFDQLVKRRFSTT